MMTDNTVAHHVLVTGAAGRIGSYFASHNGGKYRLRLLVRGDEEGIDQLTQYGEVVQADLADLNALKRACEGIETVVHMAGDPSPSALWADLLAVNIIGTYNLFAAAKAQGVKRVIYASSIHAVSGYTPDIQVKTNEPVNPGDLYGVSKCFGEALARYMSGCEGVQAIALRIGGFQPLSTVQKESGVTLLDDWVSERDLNQLLHKCIDVEGVTFAILHALSDNRFKRLDISTTRTLVGYAPQDAADREIPAVKDVPLEKMETASLRDAQQSGLRADV